MFHSTWLTAIPRGTDKEHESLLGELLGSFDVTRYDECQNWAVVEWAVAIEFRHLLDVQLRHLTQYKQSGLYDDLPLYGPYDPKFVRMALQYIRRNPTSLTHLDQELDPVDRAVRDMTVGEMMWALDDLTYPKEKLDSASLRQIRSDAQLMSQSIDDACVARGNYPLPNDRLALVVDFSKTDDNIRQDFANWLNQKRRESMDSIGRNWWARFDKKTFSKWHRYHLLGCIDLELLAKAAGLRLTHKQMADALYPQVDLEQTEHIRKTVRPLAERVVNWQTVFALRAATQ